MISVQLFAHYLCRDYDYFRIFNSDNISPHFGGVHHTLKVYQNKSSREKQITLLFPSEDIREYLKPPDTIQPAYFITSPERAKYSPRLISRRSPNFSKTSLQSEKSGKSTIPFHIAYLLIYSFLVK